MNLFLGYDVVRVADSGLNLGACEPILLGQVRNGHSRGEPAQDNLHGHARPPYDRLPVYHVRIHDDVRPHLVRTI